MMRVRVLPGVVLAVLSVPVFGAGDGDAVHKGVATCASSVCHGSARDKPDSPLLRNEYLTWERHDDHSDAYQTLQSDASRRIARRLDIGPAHEAQVCLDCHTDAVPPEQRGKRFVLSDGVGCEACHGGAENWLESHSGSETSHAQNVKNGLVPLEKAGVRAEVCQDCHIGDQERFLGHDLLGAGHPRLQFELMSFSVLQPYHYRADEDYYERKPEADRPARIWAIGQIEAARRMLEGIQSKDFMTSPLWPELAFFDCHGCHTPMSVEQPEERYTSPGLTPGSPRLNDSALMMALMLERVIPGGTPETMLKTIRRLHGASRKGPAQVRSVARELEPQLEALADRLETTQLTTGLQRELLGELTRAGARGRFSGYLSAEQAAMAAQVLLKHGQAGVEGSVSRQLDPVFDALDNPDRPDDDAFQQAMKQLRAFLEQ
jgi:hypothetical protein